MKPVYTMPAPVIPGGTVNACVLQSLHMHMNASKLKHASTGELQIYVVSIPDKQDKHTIS